MTSLLSITIRNFFSVGNITQTINLSSLGLTLILGENIDIGAGNSRNGVGKTTLLQAISYALFGDPLTKIKLLDNCVNNINNKGMLVTIEFESDGKKYRIERGRKPNHLKLFEEGVDINAARGKNCNTQEEIDRLLGMSHLMFKHVVALNTDTRPFMKLEAKDQRAVIEELLGITQLSQRAAALKDLSDLTKDQLKDEEAKIKANTEANARIEQAIDRARAEADAWQSTHDRQVIALRARVETMHRIDIDVELAMFTRIEDWQRQRKEIDDRSAQSRQNLSAVETEIARLHRELQRYQEEAARVDNGEIARLEAQLRRYLCEADQDIKPQLYRLTAEAERRRNEAQSNVDQAQKLAAELTTLQAQHDNPDTHVCTTCGQGLAGTHHLAKVMQRLQAQIADVTGRLERVCSQAEKSLEEADTIETEIAQTKEGHTTKQEEARSKAKAIQQDVEVARTVLEQQKQFAAERVAELREMISSALDSQESNKTVIHQADEALATLGLKPASNYPNREAVWKVKQDRDVLLAQIETEAAKPNVHLSKIEGLQSTLMVVDYEPVNELNLRLKHEIFLYKLLTAKDSFIRKKIVDQNLLYLNNRMNHYCERLGLPHEVRFLPDLTVDITMLGRDLDYNQLSRGESNRVVLATWLSFRDVWESLNSSFSLVICDEVLDFGMDDHGAEAALALLQAMARDRRKNVFLISHKENLIGRADRVMLVRKEDQFTSFVENYQPA